jgi:hypothetical protein
LQKTLLAAAAGFLAVVVACGQGESPATPNQPPTPPAPAQPQPPVSGNQWVRAATSPLGVEVYMEIFYACSCPNYARTFMFWDVVGRREIGRMEFTLAEAWSVGYVRPSDFFHVTPDGTRLGVRMYKSGKYFETYRIYDIRRARELMRITRSPAGWPFIIDDQNGATTGVLLTDRDVTLTLYQPSIWSETGDPENPSVYGTFLPHSQNHTFPIPSAF